jgi:hypothetical protein
MVLCFASRKDDYLKAISIAGSGRGHDLGASAGRIAGDSRSQSDAPKTVLTHW